MVRALELRSHSIYQPGSEVLAQITGYVRLRYRRSVRCQESEVVLTLLADSFAASVIDQNQVLRIILDGGGGTQEEWIVDDFDDTNGEVLVATCRHLIFKLAEPAYVRTIVSGTGLPDFRFALPNVLPATLLATYVRQPMVDEGHQWLTIGPTDFLAPLDRFEWERQKPLGILDLLAGHPNIAGEYMLRDTGSSWDLELVRTVNGALAPVPVRFRKNLEDTRHQARGMDLFTVIEPSGEQAPDGTPGTMAYNCWEIVTQVTSAAVDPTVLPLASAQTASWGVFDPTMRAQAVNDAAPSFLTDPVTSARWLRFTDSVTHGGGAGGYEYGAGGSAFSLPWGASGEMVTVAYIQGGTNFLLDLNVDTGVITNRRTYPGQSSQLNFSFSRQAATTRRLYYMKNDGSGNRILARWNTETNSQDTTWAEKNLAAIAPNAFHQWLHVSDDDDSFVFQSLLGQYMIHYKRSTDTATKKTTADLQAVDAAITDLDEPHATRDGAGTLILCNPSARVIWWNFATDALSSVTSVIPDAGHGDVFGSQFICVGARARTFDPAGPTGTNRYNFTEIGDSAFHYSCQWNTPTVPLADRWWQQSNSANGRILSYNSLTWTLHSGTPGVDAVWKVTPAYFSGSGQTSARMASGGCVLQYITGDRSLYRGKLTKVASVGAITAMGQWFHDQTPNVLYVRPLDNLDLGGAASNMICVTCPPALCDAIGLGKVSAFKDVRLWGHHYSHYDATIHPTDQYYPQPRAQMSQCGRVVLVNTNMGDANGLVHGWFLFYPAGGGTPGIPNRFTVADPLGGPPPIGFNGQLTGAYAFRHLKGSSQLIVNSFAPDEIEVANAAHYDLGDLLEFRKGAPTFDAIDYQQAFGDTRFPTRVLTVTPGTRTVTIDQPFSAGDPITKDNAYKGWSARLLTRILTTTTVTFTKNTMKLRVVAAVTSVQLGDIVLLTNNAVTGAPPWTAHSTHFSGRVEAIDTANKDLTLSVRPQYGGLATDLSGSIQCSIWRPAAVVEIDSCLATNSAVLQSVSAAVVDQLAEIHRAVDGTMLTELSAPTQVAVYGRRVGPLDVGRPAHGQVAPNGFFTNWSAGANALPDGYNAATSTCPVGSMRVSGVGNVVHGTFAAKIRRGALATTFISANGQPLLNVSTTVNMVVASVLRVNDGQPTAETVTVLTVIGANQVQCTTNLAFTHGNNENVLELGANGLQASGSGISTMATPAHVMPVPAPNTVVWFQAHVKAHGSAPVQQRAELRVIGSGGAVLGVAQTSLLDQFVTIGVSVQMNPGQRFHVEVRTNPTADSSLVEAWVIVDAVNWSFTTYQPELLTEYALGTFLHQAANDRLPATAFLPGMWQIQVADLADVFADEAFIEGGSIRLTDPRLGALGLTRRIRVVEGDYHHAAPTALEIETDEETMTRLMAEARVETPRVVVTVTPGSTGPVPGVTATITSVVETQPVRFGRGAGKLRGIIAPKL